MKILNSAEKIYKSQKQPTEVFYKKAVLKNVAIFRPASTGEQGEGEELSPALFKIRKKCPDFGKMSPVCVHLWVNIPI